jgi:hypothetical protein
MNTTPPSHLMPTIVVEESYFPLLNQKQFVLVLVIMQWRAAAGRSDLRPQGNFTSGLRTAKMDDNFFANAYNASPPPAETITGSASVIISTKLQPIVSLDKPCRSARGA